MRRHVMVAAKAIATIIAKIQIMGKIRRS